MAKTAIWRKIAKGLTKIPEKWRFWRNRVYDYNDYLVKNRQSFKEKCYEISKKPLEKIKTSYQSLLTFQNGRFANIEKTI